MPQQIARQRLGVRRDVEALVGRHARVRAGRDVAHRVAARLARRQAGVGQQAHRRLDVVQLDEMELHVLPGGDVAEPARVALADARRAPRAARRVSTPLRDFHAQHLARPRPAAGRRCRARGGTARHWSGVISPRSNCSSVATNSSMSCASANDNLARPKVFRVVHYGHAQLPQASASSSAACMLRVTTSPTTMVPGEPVGTPSASVTSRRQVIEGAAPDMLGRRRCVGDDRGRGAA